MGVCIVCVDASKNTGRPQNAKPFGVVKHIIAVSMKDSAGVPNAIFCSDTLDEAYFTGKINETDLSKRFYPIMDVENVESPRADNVFNEYNSGKKVLVSKGVRSFTGVLPDTTSQYAAQIDNVGSCGAVGLFLIDECGNIRGNAGKADELRPLKVSRGAWAALLAWATDATEQNTVLTFDFDKSEFDKDLGNITDGSITADLGGLEGLLDVVIENLSSDAANDTVSFDAKTIYGDICDEENIIGLLTANLGITIEGTPATITDVAEGTTSPRYVVTVSDDIIAAEEIILTITKLGLETSTATVDAV